MVNSISLTLSDSAVLILVVVQDPGASNVERQLKPTTARDVSCVIISLNDKSYLIITNSCCLHLDVHT